jgi:hypothetical protein
VGVEREKKSVRLRPFRCPIKESDDTVSLLHLGWLAEICGKYWGSKTGTIVMQLLHEVFHVRGATSVDVEMEIVGVIVQCLGRILLFIYKIEG